MSDQESKANPENFSPEHVSLEKRFAQNVDDKSDIHFEDEKSAEKSGEKSVAEKDGAYKNILSKVKTTSNDDDVAIDDDARAMDQKVDRESQITHLIDLAMAKGVVHAVKVAQKSEDYYVLDQLHDRLLADDLHEALISRGLIE